MEQSSLDTARFVVKTIAQTVVDNEKYFGDLDAVVGDGDFGYSMARGFEKVLEDWDSLTYTSAGGLCKKVATTITGRIGGTSGPIWGTGFLRAGAAIGEKQDLTPDDVIAMLRAAIAGIQQRGQSDLGDKTLLDALIPATDQLEASLKDGKDAAAALHEAAAVARTRAEATRDMLAKRGRAAYTGERSIGTLDAGAMAIAVLFERLSEVWP
jgi:dihydroxyacetone kinase-like protein